MNSYSLPDRLLSGKSLPWWHVGFLVLASVATLLFFANLYHLFHGGWATHFHPLWVSLLLIWLAWTVTLCAFVALYFLAHLPEDTRDSARILALILVISSPLALLSIGLIYFVVGLVVAPLAHAATVALLALRTRRAFTTSALH